jgi:hypothetical protein
VLQDAGSTLQYAAFFADCQHELGQVEQGRRLVLAYNLVWTSEQAAPDLEDDAAVVKLQEMAADWEASIAADAQQRIRLAFALGELRPSAAAALLKCPHWWLSPPPLILRSLFCSAAAQAHPPAPQTRAEHQYTEANLSFANLKGRDRAMALLAEACPALEARLALVHKLESGAGYDCHTSCLDVSSWRRVSACRDLPARWFSWMNNVLAWIAALCWLHAKRVHTRTQS